MKSSDPTTRDETDRKSSVTNYQGDAGKPVGVTDGGQPVVARSGDGALSGGEHKRDEGPDEAARPFGFAETTFYANEGDADGNKISNEEKYERLWKYHHQWDDDSTGRRTHKDKLHVAESLASALALSKIQKYRVRGVVANVSGRRFNKNGGIEGLALGAIAYVTDQDIGNDPLQNAEEALSSRMLNSNEFSEFCDQHGVDGWAACKKIKEVYRE